MKRNSFAFCLMILLLFSVSAPCFGAVLNVRAWIDGKSRLYIQGSNVWWYHIEAAAPGKEGDVNYPTILNSHNWYPTWSIPDDQLRDCGGCTSSVYHNLSPALATDGANIQLAIIDVRDYVSIYQQPSETNGYTAIVEFNDPDGGAYWDEINITYSGAAETASVPTLNEWGMLILALLISGYTFYVSRKKRSAA